MGILAGWKMNTWIDRSVMIFAVLGFAIPGFWLALNLIYVMCVKLGWFPVLVLGVCSLMDLFNFLNIQLCQL